MSDPAPIFAARRRSSVRPGLRPSGRRRGGFTLIEVLATLLLMAIAIPVLMQAVSVALNTADAARRKTEAAALAQSKLSELVATGDWQSAGTAGDFPDHPAYHWQSAVQAWGDGSVEQLDVEVSWLEKGIERTYVVSTLVYPAVTPVGQQDAANAASSAASSSGTGTSTGTGTTGGGK